MNKPASVTKSGKPFSGGISGAGQNIGDWVKAQPLRPLEERFWSKVDKNGPVIRPELGPCHIWTGDKGRDGYGLIRRGRNGDGVARATRVALEIKLGRRLADGGEALHHCDNPPCVRDEHLFLGTNEDNRKDMAAKGRAKGRTRRLVSDEHRTLILTSVEVSSRDLAALVGCSGETVARIRRDAGVVSTARRGRPINKEA
jgi:hypothetical protein